MTEYKTMFTLWCIVKSPLMLGSDLRTMEKTDEAYKVSPRRIYIRWREDSTLIFLNSKLGAVAKIKFHHLYISIRYDFSPNLKVIAQKMSLPRP